jgi:hypothetical protein
MSIGDNGTIVYALLNYQHYFTIDSITGQVDCIHTLDREEIPSLDLYIVASDRDSHVQLQSICMTLHVTVNDVNDHSPQFSRSTYQFELFFDLPRFTVFGQVYATDADENARLIYSLEPNPYLKVHPRTGHLRIKYPLYRLIDQIFNVTVKVSDGRHVNQTFIYVRVRPFIDAQQPILLMEPAFGVTINESTAVNSILSNIYRRFQLNPMTIDFMTLMTDAVPIPFTLDAQGIVFQL